jgi:hypothetical protein
MKEIEAIMETFDNTAALDNDPIMMRADETRRARGYFTTFEKPRVDLPPLEMVLRKSLSEAATEFYSAFENETRARGEHLRAQDKLDAARAQLASLLDHLDTVPIPEKS